MSGDTVPCQFCGRPTPMTGTKMCDNCWEVDRRIDDFVTSRPGLLRVHQALMRFERTLSESEAQELAAMLLTAEVDHG